MPTRNSAQRSVLISGVNRGIGLALARKAVSMNYHVYGSVRTDEHAQNIQDMFGDDVSPLLFDVTDKSAICEAAQLVKQIDIIINNAGVIGPEDTNTLTATSDEFSEVFAVNSIAPLNVSQVFMPKLTRPGGKIISISSQMSWMGYDKSDRIAYRASKAALNKIMQGLARDLASQDIAVCVIDPGWVRTDMGGAAADNDPQDVAAGIWRVIDGLSMVQTGKFMRWTGEEREY